MTTTDRPAAGELWNDTNRNTRTRLPVRIQSVDDTHATVTHELDGETLPGTRRIHLSHFGRPGGYTLAADRPAVTDKSAATPPTCSPPA